MPRRSKYDRHEVAELIRKREHVVTHSELMALGMPRSTIVSRMQTDGIWQRLLPGVVLCHRGWSSDREQMLGAVAYGGPESMISGWSGLRAWEFRERSDSAIHLLIPHQHQRTSHHFVVVERTTKLPEPVQIMGVPVAPLPRCVIDACRRPKSFDRVRAVVAEAVQRHRCTPRELFDAAAQAATQRMALTNGALREIEVGVRSVAEAKARLALGVLPFAQPEWNVRIVDEKGAFVAMPDAWDDDVCAALQVDSMEWHLSPAAYKRTQRTFRKLQRNGAFVLPVAPSDITQDPGGFRQAWIDIREQAARRPRPHLYVERTDPKTAA